MDSYFSKKTIRNIGLTLLFYLISFISFYFLNKFSPSGPRTPGLGIMSLLLLAFISAVLFLKNILKVVNGHKDRLVSAIIHSLVTLGFFRFVFIRK